MPPLKKKSSRLAAVVCIVTSLSACGVSNSEEASSTVATSSSELKRAIPVTTPAKPYDCNTLDEAIWECQQIHDFNYCWTFACAAWNVCNGRAPDPCFDPTAPSAGVFDANPSTSHL